MVIYDYYKTLDRARKTIFREKIMREANFSSATFHLKLRQKKFNSLELTAISHIIDEFEDARKNGIL